MSCRCERALSYTRTRTRAVLYEQIWRLRFGNRYVMPVRNLTAGARDLEGRVRCELCTLETSAPRTEQRLFLAQLNGVMVRRAGGSTLLNTPAAHVQYE